MTIWSIPGAEGEAHSEEIAGTLVEYTTPRPTGTGRLNPGT